MALQERQCRIDKDVQIDEWLAPHAAGAKRVPTSHRRDPRDRCLNRFELHSRKRAFYQFMEDITHGPPTGHYDHQPDNDSRNLIGMPPAQESTKPSNEDSYRRERVGAVVPGVGVQGRAPQLARNANCTSVDPLLGKDSDRCYENNSKPWISLLSRIEGRTGLPRDVEANEDQRSRNQGQRGSALPQPVRQRASRSARAHRDDSGPLVLTRGVFPQGRQDR